MQDKEGMYPLLYFKAKQLYDIGLPIFLLYRDNTEKRVTCWRGITEHDWVYGIEKTAWQEFLNTESAIGYIRAANCVADAANDVDWKYQIQTGEMIGDWFNHKCFGAGIEYEGYLDDKYEEKWLDVPEDEIEEESDEEYYKSMRPYIVPLVAEFTSLMYAWFKSTRLEKIPKDEIYLKLCERIAADTDNYLFGSRTQNPETK